MNFFGEIRSEDELKSKFKDLANRFHPDRGGNVEIMQAINAQYDEILECLLRGQDFFGVGLEDRLAEDKELRSKIEEISGLEGLEIELCGNWLWITGDTIQHRDILKGKGFRWARKKQSWYFYTGEYKKRGKKTYSLEEIRDVHGSIRINQEKFKRAAIA